MKYFLYCAIKQTDLIPSFFYSAYSLTQTITDSEAEYKFVLITDMADDAIAAMEYINEELKQKITIERIEKEAVDNWLGENQYIFRVKIKAIQYFQQKYNSDVFYIDCDMVAKINCMPLFDLLDCQKFFMFAKYGLQMGQFIRDAEPQLIHTDHPSIKINEKDILTVIKDGSPLCTIDLNKYPYLSCVIGIPKHFSGIVDEALALCDDLYALTKLRTIEEISFMIVFQKYASVILTTNYFATYDAKQWNRYILGHLCGFFIGEDKNKFLKMVNSLQIRVPPNTYTYKLFCYLQALFTCFKDGLLLNKSNLTNILEKNSWQDVDDDWSFIANIMRDYTGIEI